VRIGSVGGLKKGLRVGETMTDFEYEALLDRARDKIPDDISARSRWSLPEPDVMIEGSQTILRNFAELVSMMDRDANHVYQFLQNELGTSGTLEKGRVLLKGRIPPRRIKERIVVYVKTYILCHQCNAPDTSFIKADRTTLLKCQACGGTRPVKL
jgi:translation initiation factor 2 subunit 2